MGECAFPAAAPFHLSLQLTTALPFFGAALSALASGMSSRIPAEPWQRRAATSSLPGFIAASAPQHVRSRSSCPSSAAHASSPTACAATPACTRLRLGGDGGRFSRTTASGFQQPGRGEVGWSMGFKRAAKPDPPKATAAPRDFPRQRPHHPSPSMPDPQEATSLITDQVSSSSTINPVSAAPPRSTYYAKSSATAGSAKSAPTVGPAEAAAPVKKVGPRGLLSGPEAWGAPGPGCAPRSSYPKSTGPKSTPAKSIPAKSALWLGTAPWERDEATTRGGEQIKRPRSKSASGGSTDPTVPAGVVQAPTADAAPAGVVQARTAAPAGVVQAQTAAPVGVVQAWTVAAAGVEQGPTADDTADCAGMVQPPSEAAPSVSPSPASTAHPASASTSPASTSPATSSAPSTNITPTSKEVSTAAADKAAAEKVAAEKAAAEKAPAEKAAAEVAQKRSALIAVNRYNRHANSFVHGVMSEISGSQVKSHSDPKPKFRPLGAAEVDAFKRRGISLETLNRNGVSLESVWSASEKRDMDVIAFPCKQDDAMVNVLYRSLHSGLSWMVEGAKPIAFGHDDALNRAEFIIVESEIDKLSLDSAGIENAICFPGIISRSTSVNGVKDSGYAISPDIDKYLWNCRELFRYAERIIIATGNDAPGEALSEELVRRLGRERCWQVRWPKAQMVSFHADADSIHAPAAAGSFLADTSSSDVASSSIPAGADSFQAASNSFQAAPVADHGSDSASVHMLTDDGTADSSHTNGIPVHTASNGDHALAHNAAFPFGNFGLGRRHTANDVLCQSGAESLRNLVSEAVHCPIDGVFQFHDYNNAIWDYYNQVNPEKEGVSSGWPSLDDFYKVVPGELTVLTGVPNSGKSEWIDALLVNLARENHWCFAFCSMEKNPRDHARQLLEKYLGKPFFGEHTTRERMVWPDVELGMQWIGDHFHILRKNDGEAPTIDWILSRAKIAVFRHGIRGLVIDPYNELDHARPSYMNETEYVSQMLGKVKRFAQLYDCHVWFVAHPRQLHAWQGQAPTLYDISGSANFINKADNGIVVHRPWNLSQQETMTRRGDPGKVDILVRKVRNKEAGCIGQASLFYNIPTGRYTDGPETDAIDVELS